MNKVLIVDDEPNILMSLEFLMRKERYEVYVARDGHEALILLDREVPSIVILDVMMPEVDGYEVCQYIKQSNDLKHTKVVFLSAKSKKEDIEKGYELGADLYMTKPFSTRQLMKEVKKLNTIKEP